MISTNLLWHHAAPDTNNHFALNMMTVQHIAVAAQGVVWTRNDNWRLGGQSQWAKKKNEDSDYKQTSPIDQVVYVTWHSEYNLSEGGQISKSGERFGERKR